MAAHPSAYSDSARQITTLFCIPTDVCVRACVRAYVCVCACARARVRACAVKCVSVYVTACVYHACMLNTINDTCRQYYIETDWCTGRIKDVQRFS